MKEKGSSHNSMADGVVYTKPAKPKLKSSDKLGRAPDCIKTDVGGHGKSFRTTE
jgi:hypothetical protein